MTGAKIKERLAFATEIYNSLLTARRSCSVEEINGLERAIVVLTDVVMEMGKKRGV